MLDESHFNTFEILSPNVYLHGESTKALYDFKGHVKWTYTKHSFSLKSQVLRSSSIELIGNATSIQGSYFSRESELERSQAY